MLICRFWELNKDLKKENEVKEIKDFIRLTLNHKYDWCLEDIMESSEYKALKALADQPVSKMEITDDMVELAIDKLYENYDFEPSGRDRQEMKTALEAVFASLQSNVSKPVSANNAPSEQAVTECDQLDIEKEVHQPSYNAGWADCLESIEGEKKEPQKQTLLENAQVLLREYRIKVEAESVGYARACNDIMELLEQNQCNCKN